MSDILSEDQIEALVAQARGGGEVTAHTRKRARTRRVRAIDFSRPSKFTQEQQKRLERAHDAFCRTTTNQLSAELRMPVELEVINVAQHVWASGLAEVPSPSVFAVVGVRGQSNRVLIGFELPGMLRMIVRLLGGPDEARAADRELTEIELALTRRIFTTLIGELSIVWSDLLGVELELLGLETALSAVQLVPPSDPSMTITVETRFRDASSTISLILPHRSIASAMDTLSSGQYGDADGGDADAGNAEQMRASLADVMVEVRAEVAAVELPIEDVVAIEPGDVIRFGVPAAAGVMLYADRVAIHRARPGRSETARAVSVLENVERPS